MPEILVISGKGGTGKTTITASLAVLAGKAVLADCDVDAADLHLVLNPVIKERHVFFGNPKARINRDKCLSCGQCQQNCRFEAIEELQVNSMHCEGCGVCSFICPAGAIEMVPHQAGEYYVSETEYGPMVHAALGLAEENSGKLVAKVKQLAGRVAAEAGIELRLTDGPPGIGCPVLAALADTDHVLVVVEPSVSGLHDAERVFQLCRKFETPVSVCINKFDLDSEAREQIEAVCSQHNVPVLGRVPFDRVVVEAVAQGQPLVSYRPNSIAAKAVASLWERLRQLLNR